MKIKAGVLIGLIAFLGPLMMSADELPDPCGGLPCPPPPLTVTAENLATSTVENIDKLIYLRGESFDENPVSFIIMDTSSANGTVGAPSGNTVLYTPNLDFVGEASFTYRAIAGEAQSADAVITITVLEDMPPVLTASSHVVIATSSFSFMPVSVYPTAVDDTDTDVEITYEPTSFPTGTTEVTWTAVDDAGNETTLITQITVIEPVDVEIPNGCTVTDSSDEEHVFEGAIGICVLQAALDAGNITELSISEASWGGYSLDSVNGIAYGPTEFWSQWLNESFAMLGIGEQTVAVGDVYSIILADWMNNNAENPSNAVAFRIVAAATETTEPPASSGGGGGGGGGILHLTFNTPLAISYIASKQNANGSFENDLLTSWVALAFSAYDAGAAKTSLRNYLLSYSPTLSSATDYQRHAMALMALGIDPYTGTGRDFISPIIGFFDGTQIGDAALATDDIFALFPLTHAGYSASDEMIRKIIVFIIASQQSNGSWTGGVDVTAAAVQALAPFTSQPGVSAALSAAQNYLRGQQQANGGFSNSFATSWTMQAISALGQTESQWSSSTGYYPTDYLASLQQTDGGVEPVTTSVSNRVWATSYAVPGALGKTWNSLLSNFSKPAGITGGGVTATSTATSTAPVATSTSPVATTTPAVVNIIETVGEVLGLAIENTEPVTASEPVPPEVVAQIVQVVESLATSTGTTTISNAQVAAASVGIPEKYYFLFALLVLLLYGFTWYMLSWRRYWK